MSGSGSRNYTPPASGSSSIGSVDTKNTIAELRANVYDGTVRTIIVLGYDAPGDGGGGTYVVVTSDTTSADNGGTIIVDASSTRWYLQL